MMSAPFDEGAGDPQTAARVLNYSPFQFRMKRENANEENAHQGPSALRDQLP